jgi:hypothetical protein
MFRKYGYWGFCRSFWSTGFEQNNATMDVLWRMRSLLIHAVGLV